MEEKAQTKEKQKQPTEIVISKPEVVGINTISKPLVNVEDAIKAWEEYQGLSKAICTKADVQIIQGREFKKKSFWRKIDKFFGLSLELISEKEEVKNALIRIQKGSKKEIEYYPLNSLPEIKDSKTEQVKKTFVFTVVYRATAPNGQYMDGDGACDTWEDGYADSYHNVRATAHTRAKNRAIADLVGFGEVSAEEIRPGNKYNSSPPQKPAASPSPSKTEVDATNKLEQEILTLVDEKKISDNAKKKAIDYINAKHPNGKKVFHGLKNLELLKQHILDLPEEAEGVQIAPEDESKIGDGELLEIFGGEEINIEESVTDGNLSE